MSFLQRSAVRSVASSVKQCAPLTRAFSSLSSSVLTRSRQASPKLGLFAGAVAFGLFATASLHTAASEEKKSTVLPSGLDPANFVPLTLTKIEKYNHDTSVFYLRLPAGASAVSNLPIPSFVLVRATIDGKEEVRPYTPIDQHEHGVVKLLIKDYPTGKISRYFHTLKVGDKVDLKGPLPKFKYQANMRKNIGMIAGGTGITPFLQVLEEIVSDPSDKTQVTLLFGNRSPADVLLRERLDAITAAHKNIKVVYIVDKADAKWKGLEGFITPELLKKYMPAPTEGNQVYICGPPPMMKAFSGMKKSPVDQGELTGALKDLGYSKDNVFKF